MDPLDPIDGLLILAFCVFVGLLISATLVAIVNYTIPYLCRKVIDHRETLSADHPAAIRPVAKEGRLKMHNGAH